jgi:hypothetical protein
VSTVEAVTYAVPVRDPEVLAKKVQGGNVQAVFTLTNIPAATVG